MGKKIVTEIWDRYQMGVDHHRTLNMYAETERNHRFFRGDQWHGLKSGGEDLPIFNFIKPVGKYKISMIAQNAMSIVYSSLNGDDDSQRICDILSGYAESEWEKSKMDSLMWGMIKRAFIAGDNYLYCYYSGKDGGLRNVFAPKLKHRIINNTNIYFSDEQNPEINEQEYIMISERLPVAQLRREAKQNGVAKDMIDLIVSDEDTDTQIGEDANKEVKTDLGKCTSVLYMKKTNDGIEFCKSVERVVYQPMQTIKGLKVYPVVGMRWEEIVGSARGSSGVKYMIPNQLEVNKTAARRALAVKKFAYPTTVYDPDAVENADKLREVGANIKVRNMAGNSIKNLIDYLSPVSISSDADKLQNEFIEMTRSLEGAGDAATGEIDPTKASGEAIKAARDQAAVPLNEQIALYKQLIEDIAHMWYSMWTAYTDQYMQVTVQGENGAIQERISKQELDSIDIDIRIDVSPIDPYSKVSQEISLGNLLNGKYISFEEYVSALDDTSSTPKAKLEAIIEQRRQLANEQITQEQEIQQMREEQMMQQQPDVIGAQQQIMQ